MDFLHKLDENIFKDLYWNIPEQKQGKVNIIGGNAQSFRTSVKTAEYLLKNYPLANVNLVLPDILKTKLPPMPDTSYLKSTETGSFADSEELKNVMALADYNLVIGDLSKNTITGQAIASACENSAAPLLVTRDTVDLLAENTTEKSLMNENLVVVGSMAQIRKLFRAVYYPKVLTLSQSLVQVTEALHKFTLSYPVAMVTIHNEQIIVAKNGTVNVIPLQKSGFTPILFWNGEIAAKIVALNLYNPNNFIQATSAAVFA